MNDAAPALSAGREPNRVLASSRTRRLSFRAAACDAFRRVLPQRLTAIDGIDRFAAVLLVCGLGLFLIGLGLEGPTSTRAVVLAHFDDWAPGLVIDGLLLFTVNAIFRRQERSRTLARIGGLSREFALEAVREAREMGWLASGALRRHNLKRASLARADLSDADLRDVELVAADLSDADLQHADLRDANLEGANLSGADLRWCRLSGANLRWADLRGALLEGAWLDDVDARHASIDARHAGWHELRGAVPGGYLNPDEIAAIRTSLRRIEALGTAPVRCFYRRLFELAPDVKPLFRDDLESQSRKFLQSLQLIVAGLEAPERHIAVLQRLGVRHGCYGVEPRHYAAVGDALLGMLEETLESGFGVELASAWRRTYELISSVMIDAAARAAKDGAARS